MATPTAEGENPKPKLWDQFKELIELHKFYFENITKSGAVSLGIVGAVASYVLGSEIRNSKGLFLALSFPLLLGIGVFVFTAVGYFKTSELASEVKKLQRALGLSWRPHAEVLPWICGTFALISFAVTAALLYAGCNPELLPDPPPKK